MTEDSVLEAATAGCIGARSVLSSTSFVSGRTGPRRRPSSGRGEPGTILEIKAFVKVRIQRVEAGSCSSNVPAAFCTPTFVLETASVSSGSFPVASTGPCGLPTGGTGAAWPGTGTARPSPRPKIPDCQKNIPTAMTFKSRNLGQVLLEPSMVTRNANLKISHP